VNKQPLIISHRGDCIRGIENTIDACEKAIQNGANGLEIDIRQTGSGEIVVFHDFSLKRMFDMPGYVGRTAFDQLRTYPYKHSIDGAEPQYIDTLDNFLEHFNNRIPINLDAKTIHFFDFKFAHKIINAIKRHNLIDSVWISCFNPFLLQIIKLIDQKVKTGYLFQRMTWMHTLYDLITWSDAWHPHYRIVNDNLVKKAKKYGKEIYVWTVNEEPTITKLCDYSVNGLITDEVALIYNSLNI